jgi:hypothetical protein
MPPSTTTAGFIAAGAKLTLFRTLLLPPLSLPLPVFPETRLLLRMLVSAELYQLGAVSIEMRLLGLPGVSRLPADTRLDFEKNRDDKLF